MSIKTDQLRHSLQELEQKTGLLSAWKGSFSEETFREHIEEVSTSTLDCLTIIYHILSDIKET